MNKTRVVRDFLSVDSMNIKTLLPRDYVDFFFSLSQFGSLSNNLVIVNTGSHGTLWIYAEMKSVKYWTLHNWGEMRSGCPQIIFILKRWSLQSAEQKLSHMFVGSRPELLLVWDGVKNVKKEGGEKMMKMMKKKTNILLRHQNSRFYLFMGTSISVSFWRSNILT